jgi:iron complex transport system permease protein
VLIQYTSDFTDVSHMLTWMIGGLESVQLVWVKYAAAPILIGLAVLVAYSRELNALAAGPEAAASVGVAVGRTQTVVFAVASLLVGTAISLVGPIGFIGLIIPHALRAVLGPDHRVLLPASMLGGAAVLTVCDTLARTVVPLNHLPTGALTAVLGAIFFLVILVGYKRRARAMGTAMSAVLRHVIESISPASEAHGDAARRRVSAAGIPILERLAYTLGAAQHTRGRAPSGG